MSTRAPTETEIDDGARALRAHQMAGRITLEWTQLPNSQKRKWLTSASIVLRAALAGDMQS